MKILLLAGEESGAVYARHIREAAARLHPDAEFRGYDDCGFRIADLAVMGIWAVLRKIFYFLRVKRTMERVIDDWQPDVVCGVDYPGMNLKLESYAKARGIRTVHVVCPQVWAWKKGRIPKIEASVGRLCCFFPFEPALFRPGFAEFVGHPLVDEMALENAAYDRNQLEIAVGGKRKLLAVLPGSRMSELEKHVPTLLKVVEMLQREIAELEVVIPAASEKAFTMISAAVVKSVAKVTIQRGGARDVLRRADAAVVASGTATMEAALAGCPTVLIYRVSAAFALLLRHLIKDIKHVGLANIIAEKSGAECPMPELLQEAFTTDNVLAWLRPWLLDASANAAARQALANTMRLLSSDGGAIRRIADCLIA